MAACRRLRFRAARPWRNLYDRRDRDRQSVGARDPKSASVGGAYMTVTNKGSEADRLIGALLPIAGNLEVHQMTMDKGVVSMRPVQGGLEIKPGQTVVLNPESSHIMLMGLKQPLAQGAHIKVTLDFAKAGRLDLEYVVESMGAQGPGGAPAGMDRGAMGPVH